MKKFVAIILCLMFLIGCAQTTKGVDTKNTESTVESETNNQVMLDSNGNTIDLSTANSKKTVIDTPAPTQAPTQIPTNTPTPMPTAIPKDNFIGAWKACGIIIDDGTYFSVDELETVGNYNLTDIYYILNDECAEAYNKGEKYYDVSWTTTDIGIVLGTLEMTFKDGSLYWKLEDEIVRFKHVSGIQSVDDIISRMPTAKPTATVEPTATATPKLTEKPTEKPTEAVKETPTTYTYILNSKTKKFHYPSCRDVDKIKSENKKTFNGTREEVIKKGYSPCGHCHP